MDRAPRLKLPLSLLTDENFLSALRTLGSEKLPMRTAYRLGRTIKEVNEAIETFNAQKLDSIKKNGAIEVARVYCHNRDCNELLTGPQNYDALCPKCGTATMIPNTRNSFWQIPPEEKGAIEAFQEELQDALKVEVEVFMDSKLKFSELDGVKLPALAVAALLPILEEA